MNGNEDVECFINWYCSILVNLKSMWASVVAEDFQGLIQRTPCSTQYRQRGCSWAVACALCPVGNSWCKMVSDLKRTRMKGAKPSTILILPFLLFISDDGSLYHPIINVHSLSINFPQDMARDEVRDLKTAHLNGDGFSDFLQLICDAESQGHPTVSFNALGV